jgi:HSP20 family protein
MFRNRMNNGSTGVRNELNRRYFYSNEQYGQERNWNTKNHNCMNTPACDVLELDDQYILELALPGVNLDDVEIKVEYNTLTVVAKRTPSLFEERAIVLRQEMGFHHLVREFDFDTEILHEQIEARLERGILFVSVPKVDAALRIPVSAGSIEGQLQGNKTRVGKQDSMRQDKLRQDVSIKG